MTGLTKKEICEEIKRRSGEELNPDDFSKLELEAKLYQLQMSEAETQTESTEVDPTPQSPEADAVPAKSSETTSEPNEGQTEETSTTQDPEAKAPAPEDLTLTQTSDSEVDPTPQSEVPMVKCVLGPDSPVGRLLVPLEGRSEVVISQQHPGQLPASEFQRLKDEYNLIEV